MTNEEITKRGNPSRPTGEEGSRMLQRMNESHEEVTNWGLDFLDIENPQHILDVGCGGGATLGRLAGRFPNAQVTGIDISDISVQESLKYNREFIKKGQVQVQIGSVEAIAFEEYFFDGIVTVESFYFWPDPVDNLKEVRRVLKEEGTFLLIADIHNHEGLSQHAKDNVKNYAMRNPTVEEFYQYMSKAGFASCQVHVKGDWVCVVCKR